MPIIEGLGDLNQAASRINNAIGGNGLIRMTDTAGQIIFDEVKIRAKGSIKDNLTIKTDMIRPGVARSSIEVEGSVKGGENHHAVFIEYGTSKMAAQPFMRPAYDASSQRAADAFTTELAKALEAL